MRQTKKILIIHNRYQNRGGEDIAVNEEVKILKKKFDVETIFFENNKINLFYIFFTMFFSNNISSNKTVQDKINQFKPDVVYIHNTWFQGSLGVFKTIKENNIKILLKLHNFRYHCTKSHLAKNHLSSLKICKACGFKNGKFKFYNKYFEESYIKSFFINIYGKRYLKILKDNDISVAVLTKFHKKFIKENDYKDEKVYVLPNFISLSKNIKNSQQDYLVYAGRVSREKGVDELIAAFKNSNLKNFKLIIIGKGPFLDFVSNKYSSENIKFYGELDNNEVLNIIAKSTAVVTSTKLYEGQPTLLCEASSLGIPSIYPKTGGISEFFPNNYQLEFKQFDYKNLVNIFNKLNDKKLMEKIGIENKNYINKNFNEEVYLNTFKEIINI